MRAGNELYNRDESGGRKPLGFGKCVPKRERHELAGLFEGFVARVLVLNTLSMHNMFLCKTIVLARTKGKLLLKSCIQIARRGHTASVLALGEKKKKSDRKRSSVFGLQVKGVYGAKKKCFVYRVFLQLENKNSGSCCSVHNDPCAWTINFKKRRPRVPFFGLLLTRARRPFTPHSNHVVRRNWVTFQTLDDRCS